MTIGKRLYAGFGLILVILAILFLVNIFTGYFEKSARTSAGMALDSVRTVEAVRYQIMSNRLNMNNFLLSGDPRDEDKVNKGLTDMADLIKRGEAQSTNSANNASTVSAIVTIGGTLFAVVAGILIALWTAKSITEPLNHLMTVTREIGDSGDLDQNIDIHRNDEIGALATTFNNMVAYLKEMASVSMSVAEGDLTVEVVPRSKRDTLGNAFLRMSHGLQQLVRTTRDSAGQVSAGSNQVAGAADESAKVSVQASSAIEEVSSTMHEMSINVQNVVKNTQIQASSVAETSASIDQMVTSIQRVADTAKVLLDIANRSREEVVTGIQTMEKATDGLNRTNKAIQSSAEIINIL